MKTILMLGAALLLCSGAASAGNVVVLGGGTGQATVSEGDARDMFLGRKTLWGNGAKVRVCLLRGLPSEDAFYTRLVQKGERDFNAYWVRRLFSGNGVPPTMVTSTKELGDFLGTNPGAVCYVDAGLLAGINPPPTSHPLP